MFNKKTGKAALDREPAPSLFEGESAASPGARSYSAGGPKRAYRGATALRDGGHEGEAPPRLFDELGGMPRDPFHNAIERDEREGRFAPIGNLKAEQPETTIGAGVVVKGELHFQRLLRVDGLFEGTLISDGKLIVGPHGVIKSDISLKEAVIEGKVEGNIAVERLELRGEAVVSGDITAHSLSVDEGVAITGLVQVTPSTSPREED